MKKEIQWVQEWSTGDESIKVSMLADGAVCRLISRSSGPDVTVWTLDPLLDIGQAYVPDGVRTFGSYAAARRARRRP